MTIRHYRLILQRCLFLLCPLVMSACESVPRPEGASTTAAPMVLSFTLIDADKNIPIKGFDPIREGAILDLNILPQTLNVRANVTAKGVASVRFALNGSSNFRTESEAPYALAGDRSGNYYAWTPRVGEYRLSATPYGKPGASGAAGNKLTLIFVVTRGAASNPGGFKTRVGISGERWLINGQASHAGSRAEGLLLNARMVQATFEDSNVSRWRYPNGAPFDRERQTAEFIAMIPRYAAQGLSAVTLNLQGGGPSPKYAFNHAGNWQNSAFRRDGSLKDNYLKRLDRVIRALDEHGMVAIVGFFYFGQDQRLQDEQAVIRAVDNATDWLLEQGYRNVVVEISNEADHSRYDHAILKSERAHELIRRVQRRGGNKLLVSTSFKGGVIPPAAVLDASDYILLHGNGQTPQAISDMVGTVRRRLTRAKPIVFNEDSTSLANFNAAVAQGASWGYYDQGRNNYHDGFQSPPTNWAINTAAKRTFFDRVKTLTSSPR